MKWLALVAVIVLILATTLYASSGSKNLGEVTVVSEGIWPDRYLSVEPTVWLGIEDGELLNLNVHEEVNRGQYAWKNYVRVPSPWPGVKDNEPFLKVRFEPLQTGIHKARLGYLLGRNSYPRVKRYSTLYQGHLSKGRLLTYAENYFLFLYCQDWNGRGQWILKDWRAGMWSAGYNSVQQSRQINSPVFYMHPDCLVVVVSRLTEDRLVQFASALEIGQKIGGSDLPGPYQVIDP